MQKYYTIGQVADYLNISVEAIRFYEKKGVIPTFIRDENNYRLINHKQLLILKGITQLKQAGFSLEEIKKINSDAVSSEPEKQYKILSQGISKIQDQILNLERTKEKLMNDISELKYFYSLVEKDCFIQKADEKFKVIDLNGLTINHLLSEENMFFSIRDSLNISSFYLLKAVLYKNESDIEDIIKYMMNYGKKKNFVFNGSIFLNVLSSPSYYTGDALATIIYIGLEGDYANKSRV